MKMRMKRCLRPSGYLMALSILALFSVMLLAGCSDSGEVTAPGKATVVNAVGERAVDFTLNTFDGKEFSLSGHAGSPVLINFFASWCGPCRLEGPLMEKLYKSFRARGVVFVGVAVQDSEEGSGKYLKRYGWTFPAGPDRDGRISDAYNVRGIPKTFIIKRDGTVGYIQSGVMPEEYLAGKIEKILRQ